MRSLVVLKEKADGGKKSCMMRRFVLNEKTKTLVDMETIKPNQLRSAIVVASKEKSVKTT